MRHIVYSCVPRPDAKTARLRGAVEAAGGAWRDVLALSEADLAALVRADGVDILVDLTGHTANNRLGAFAMRPAPIQVCLPALMSMPVPASIVRSSASGKASAQTCAGLSCYLQTQKACLPTEE